MKAQYSIVIPRFNDDDGSKIPSNVYAWIENSLLNAFGRLSRQDVFELWKNEAREVGAVASFRYDCLADDTPANDNAINEIAIDAKYVCDRESVLWYKTAVSGRIV